MEREQERLADLIEQTQQKEAEAAVLEKEIEKVKQKNVDIESIDKIEAKPVLLSASRVSLEKSEYETLAIAAKKYYAQEKRESKLQKALDASHKLIGELKAQVASLTAELSKYKSVRRKLNLFILEQENEELRSKVRRYESVIDRQNLRHLFGRGCVKNHSKDYAR